MPNSNQPLMRRLSASTATVEQITGERPHVATMHRWATRGLAGVKLRTIYAGGHRRTTEPWIRDFFAAVTAAKDGRPAPGNSGDTSPSESRRRAERELAAAGI